MDVLSEQVVAIGLSIPSGGVGLRDGYGRKEADWGACWDGGWNVDSSRASGSGGREYVSDFFFEPAAVEGSDGKAR